MTRFPALSLVLVALTSLLPHAQAARSSSSGKGIPCGNSYIAANKTCHIGTPSSTPATPAVPATFTSCAEAALYGRHDIPSSDPAYSAALDRDHDGIACESGGSSSAGTPAVAPLSTPALPPVASPTPATPVQLLTSPGGYTITDGALTLLATCEHPAMLTITSTRPFGRLRFSMVTTQPTDMTLGVDLGVQTEFITSVAAPVNILVGPGPAGQQVNFTLTALSRAPGCQATVTLTDLQLADR